MLKVDFKFNARDFEKAVLKAAAEGIVKRLESVRCAEHGQHPHVTVSGSNTSNMKFDVSGCCQPLIDAALVKLKG